MHPYLVDLRVAEQSGRAVELYFYGMPKVVTGVINVDEGRAS